MCSGDWWSLAMSLVLIAVPCLLLQAVKPAHVQHPVTYELFPRGIVHRIRIL
ncbi:hypothetical protein PLICRDRAFT_45619 [Plicaturopsis crispa FD-325 SS-3]|uniref:Uncharacterized protein n=1 Tax=Plicaturopsis crispa FD-325 SS-3 TaxID=944288 RepID=A0A0C9SL39_PLICR|nr:hypothetical protein PLICRDRAFT_45619 [Plicaturopsis crispa FD-325 SS-3]